VTPRRIQLRRTLGWRKPVGAIVVTRATRFGNPFTEGTRAEMVAQYRVWVTDPLSAPVRGKRRTFTAPTAEDIASLRGKDLACYCKLDGQPCHADVLLELANDDRRMTP
jgi:hypothetical protein